MFSRVLEKDDRGTSIESSIKNIKINGCGRTAPVADFDTLVEVLWMLPSVASRALRRESVKAVFRAMRGDPGLRRQIEQNNLVALPRKRRKVVHQSKQHDEPFWFEHPSVKEKRAYASMKVRTSTAMGEIDILKYCKEQLASVGRFYELDKDEFAERIRGVQWRST
ncbi:unnamed protein product, partial [Sphacelaria rigidula]